MKINDIVFVPSEGIEAKIVDVQGEWLVLEPVSFERNKAGTENVPENLFLPEEEVQLIEVTTEAETIEDDTPRLPPQS